MAHAPHCHMIPKERLLGTAADDLLHTQSTSLAGSAGCTRTATMMVDILYKAQITNVEHVSSRIQGQLGINMVGF